MALFRHPLPRRALVGAALGAFYSFLILPTGSNVVGISPVGVAWFLLSIGLLFLVPLAYHAFTIFGLLWGVYEGVVLFRGGFNVIGFLLDVLLPIAAVVLVMTSGYLAEAQAVREVEE
jgi:hypothetical protein